MKVERLSTGCEAVDDLLGGGIEKDTLTNIYGPPGCGKTTLCLQTTVSCIKNGQKVVFIDTEGGFSKERLGQIADGMDDVMNEIILIEPDNFDSQEENIERLENICEKEKKVGLIVLDSLVTLYRLELNEGDTQEINSRLANQLSTLSNLSRNHGIPILITNQIYSDIENGGVELVSRDIAKYQSKCLIEMKKFERGKRVMILRKHRSQPEGKETQVVLTENGIEKPDKKFDFL
ncbi:MAG: DNA repair and recombination protein RadB [Candidatus Aenigmatarchaeota archaeon]